MKALSGLALALLLLAPSAFAGPAFFVDAGGSYVQMKSDNAFFGNQISSSNHGYGLNLGLWTTFTNGNPPLEIQLGVEDRYANIVSSQDYYGLNVVYPVLRLQASRIFLSGGYSPYVFRSIGGSTSSNQTLSLVKGGSSLLGEVGTLLPITPRFSFGISGVYESVSVGGVKSPSPVISANLFMRFYFGFGSGGLGGRKSNEFRGWRYPFGKDLF